MDELRKYSDEMEKVSFEAWLSLSCLAIKLSRAMGRKWLEICLAMSEKSGILCSPLHVLVYMSTGSFRYKSLQTMHTNGHVLRCGT